MTRNTFIILLTVIGAIGTSVFFSCTKVDSDDTPPTMELLMPHNDDTVFIYSNTDTLILPIFHAVVKDDVGLSSYTFRIRHENDSLRAAPGDTTAYFYKNYQRVSIFGKTQDTIRHTFTVDTLITITKEDNSRETLSIWQGVYQLDASVMDMGGNITALDPINIVIVKGGMYVKKK